MTDNNKTNQSVRTGQSISKSMTKKQPPNNYATKEQSIQEPTMKFHPFQPGRPSQRYGSYSKVKEQALLYIQSNFKDGHDIAKSLRDEQLVNLSSKMPTFIKRCSSERSSIKRKLLTEEIITASKRAPKRKRALKRKRASERKNLLLTNIKIGKGHL
jgi:hypothetical protein